MLLTKEEEKAIWQKKKLSRTWRVVVYWLIMLPVAFIAQVILSFVGSGVELPLALIAGGTLTASGAYMAKRAVQANAEAKVSE